MREAFLPETAALESMGRLGGGGEGEGLPGLHSGLCGQRSASVLSHSRRDSVRGGCYYLHFPVEETGTQELCGWPRSPQLDLNPGLCDIGMESELDRLYLRQDQDGLNWQMQQGWGLKLKGQQGPQGQGAVLK